MHGWFLEIMAAVPLRRNLCKYLRGVIRGEFDEVFLQPECVKLKKIQLFKAESGTKHI